MDENKIKEIALILCGLKRSEWSRIKVTVEKQYDAASSKIELGDAASIAKNLMLEFHGTIQ